MRLGFTAFNSESEYKALIMGLKKVMILGLTDVIVHCDSQLVANQLTEEYTDKNQRMEAYMRLA